jgi:hypothetical protein
MRSTSPRGQDPVSIYSSLSSSSSSALNLSVAQNSSDSESERDYQQDRREHHHNHHRRHRPEMFSHIPHGAHAHGGGDSVMDLSVKPGQNMNFGHSGGNFSTSSLLKARGMTVSQALKSVRQATTSPKAGQNPPSSFEENLNQTLGLMGMNMSNLLSNLGNIKSTDLMAAAAAQQFLTSVTASLQQQQHHHQHQHQQQQKKNVSGSGQTSSGSGSTSPGITNNNGNSFSAKQPSLNSLSSIKQEIVKQEQSPNNSTSASKKSSGGKRSWNPLPTPVAMATHLVNPATGEFY